MNDFNTVRYFNTYRLKSRIISCVSSALCGTSPNHSCVSCPLLKHKRAINLGSRLFGDVATLYFTVPNCRVFSLANIKFEEIFKEAFLARLG